jgi:hypothetical protein
MARGKHAPNKLSSYVQIHETVMEQFLRAGFVRSENLSFADLGNGLIELSGTIECAGDIYIVVKKLIAVLEGDGPNAIVQTIYYDYNAVLRNAGNILRYDSPHETHNREHHVHRFDPVGHEVSGSPFFLRDENDRPTLGEVISEVEAWYYDHADESLRHIIGDLPSAE